jgi:hypothetical protein
MTTTWLDLNPLLANKLSEVRLNLQGAAQLVSAVGFSLAAPQSDDSQTSLYWEANLFAGVLIPAPTPVRAALDPITFTLLLLDQTGKPLAHFNLTGQTLEQGLAWLQQQLDHYGVEGPRLALGEYPPALQHHPLTQGVPFSDTPPALHQELVNYFTNTVQLLQPLVQGHTNAAALLVWPHNFDIATLHSFPDGKTIGIGLSPGDTTYPQPYWYITPAPYPGPPYPDLTGGGFWHSSGWVGAVLTGSQLTPESADQPQQVQEFITSALTASASLLAVT